MISSSFKAKVLPGRPSSCRGGLKLGVHAAHIPGQGKKVGLCVILIESFYDRQSSPRALLVRQVHLLPPLLLPRLAGGSASGEMHST